MKKLTYLLTLNFLFLNLILTAQTSLEWSPNQGCINFDDQSVEINDNIIPIEEIGISECTTVCSGTPVDFWINDPNTTLSNLSWTVNGGTFTSNGNLGINVVFNTNAGSPLSVNLEATNQNGERVTYSQCVQLSYSPIAQFEFPDNRSTYCAGDLRLINTSSAGVGSDIVSYLWHFSDDNTTSNAENPVHNFPEGAHTVTLTVTNECGCSHTVTRTQEFNHLDVEISCPTVICENQEATYQLPNFNGCSVTSWETDHGTIVGPDDENEVTIIWDQVPGSGFATLITNTDNCNCDFAKITQIPVITQTAEIVGPVTVCPDSQSLYKLPQWPSTLFNYTVTDSNGNLVTNATIRTDQHNEVIFNTSGLEAGSYTLHATYDNTLLNCGGTASINIGVEEVWEVQGPETACTFQVIDFLETNTSGQIRASANTKVYKNGQYFGQTSITGAFVFIAPGIYELNTDPFPNECQPNSYRIEIVSPPSTQSLNIDAPDEICTGVPVEFSVVLPPDTGGVWSVSNGAIQGTNLGDRIQVIFNALPTGTTNYTISIELYSLDAPDCLSSPFSVSIPPLNVTGQIINSTPAPGNNLNFCTSTTAAFTTDYLNAERYDWSLSDPSAGNINLGQGTDSIEILWNELPFGVASQVVDIELNMIECGVIAGTQTYQATLLGLPELSITAPTEVCAEDDFSVTVNSINGLPIDISNATLSATLDEVNQTNITGTQGSNLNTFTVNGLNSTNVDNNQVRDLIITVSNLNGCSGTTVASSSLTIKPTPNIVTFIQSGVLSHCATSDIDTVLEATTQAGSIGVTQYNWFRGNTLVQSGTNPVLDIAALSNPDFGSYSVEAIGLNGCTTIGNSFTIIQDCGTTVGPGGGNGGGLPECSTNNANLTLTWISCNQIQATTTVGAGVQRFQWTAYGAGTCIVEPGATATQAVFTVSNIGEYQIAIAHFYNNCREVDRESISIDYSPQLDLEAVCNNGSNDFTIDLFNNSPHRFGAYPDQVSYEYSTNNGTSWITIPSTGNNAQSTSINLPAGAYLFRMSIETPPGSPVCEDTQELDLVLPTGNFRILDKDGVEVTQTCVECPVTLEITNFNSEFTYEWDWGSGQNLALNPSIILIQNDSFIELNVRNNSGCSTTISKPITVNAASFSGNIQTSGNYCPGETSLVLSFNNNDPFNVPQEYEWLLHGAPAPGTNDQATYTVTESGVYSVRLFDQDGCSQLISGVNMIVNTLSDLRIKTEDRVCVETNFEVEGFISIPAGTSTNYFWIVDGQTTSPDPVPTNGRVVLNENIDQTGFVNITLVVEGTGSICGNSMTRSIEIVDAPDWVQLSMSKEHCDEYTVSLQAIANEPGTYYWSNGLTGSSITVNQGGPIRVVFFPEDGGCPIEETFDVPKHPSEFLWVFPEGCINLCDADAAQRFLIGPLGPQYAYDWLLNGQRVNGNQAAFVDPYDMSFADGEVQFSLSTGENNTLWCTDESGVLSSQLTECEECEIDIILTEQSYQDAPYERYVLSFTIVNFNSATLSLQLDALNNTGVFNPSFVVVPGNSSNTYTVEFIPGSNFNGSSIAIGATGEFEGEECYTQTEIQLDGERASEYRLSMTPNPATDRTKLQLIKNQKTEELKGQISIFDLNGTVVYQKNVKSYIDQIEVFVDKWVPGTYIVTWQGEQGNKVQELLIKK